MKYNEILKYNYVSFDIFDTLVKRIVYHPHQVFYLMEINDDAGILPRNFRRIRVEAERSTVDKNRYANIYDIYSNIEFSSEEARNKAMELEIAIELEVCKPNKEMIDLFNECLKAGKRIIITSDMYLPASVIEKILQNCSIQGYDKLYVSCEEKADKVGGTIFGKIIDDLNISSKELVHIGDNKKSDFLHPKRCGIASVWYREKKSRIYDTKIENIDYRNQQAYLTWATESKYRKEYDNPAFRIGYTCLGPLLYSYVKWLVREFQKNNIDRAFFLARDGKIMLDAYKAIGGDTESRYLYASRRALIVPIVWKHPNVHEVTSLFFKAKDDTVGSIVGKLGLNVDKYDEQLKRLALSKDEWLSPEQFNTGKLSAFYEEIKDDIIANSKKQYDLLGRYLKNSGFTGNVAVVDIGWFGNMQRALVEVNREYDLKANITGYYIGVDPNSKTVLDNGLHANGFLFEQGRSELRKYEKAINAIVEFLFSTTHGTVLGYRQENGNVLPILAKYEYSVKGEGAERVYDEEEAFIQIQEAALKYVRDISKLPYYSKQENKPESAFANLNCFGTDPYKEDLAYFSMLRTLGSDGKYKYFAQPSCRIMKLRKFRKEFQDTGWRVGYLKKLLPLPIPYSQIYFEIRKFGKKLD